MFDRSLDPRPAHAERLRVCMIVTYDLAAPGGVKHHAQQLAAALRKRGDDVMLVGPASARIDEPHTRTFGGVVNVPANGSDNMLGLFASPLDIRRFFRDHRFDVIHVHEPLQPTVSYWSVWTTRDIPHVATFHAFAEAEGLPLKLARRVWGTTIFPWFQRAIAVSEPAARYAAVAWSRRLSIIPNGVPTSVFRPQRVVDDGIVKLLFVGRLGDRRKGARYLLDAYRMLVERGLPVRLDIAGELGGAPPPPTLPGLHYHGAVGIDALVSLYRSCDVFVAPSTGQESFGIVLLEAMASGKPVVCSDIAGYREVVVPGGAHVVPPGDARALADVVAEVVRMDPDLRRREGELNRRAAERYDWSRIADRVRAEYLAAIADRRTSQ
jgi:phosphatidyl-myo-inositol alpha-mannosyltransferase